MIKASYDTDAASLGENSRITCREQCLYNQTFTIKSWVGRTDRKNKFRVLLPDKTKKKYYPYKNKTIAPIRKLE